MGNVDLDALRVPKEEVTGEPKTLTFGGTSYPLPDECPFEFVDLLSREQAGLALECMIGKEAYGKLIAVTPPLTVAEGVLLCGAIARMYGLGSVGESSASASSSLNGSS